MAIQFLPLVFNLLGNKSPGVAKIQRLASMFNSARTAETTKKEDTKTNSTDEKSSVY
uniref:Uncharacterized protein n=1 Tax=Dulem virus 168 TaxID=3145645 RepID=A0AAU8B9D8_9VIRU